MNGFTLELVHHDKTPLYKQLYYYIIDEIKTGRLKETERLPSKKALAKHLAISQSTIETAYEMLLTEGYIYARPRSGFYVCKLETIAPVDGPPLISPIPSKPEPRAYTFDFRTDTVDTSAFPYATWSKIAKETMYQHPELLCHGPMQGDYCLRQSLAKYLHEFRGVNCLPEQIIIGAGVEYLLDLLCQILGKEAIFALEDPGYRKTYKILANNNCTTRFIPVDQDGMNVQALQQSDATIAYITPSHQFPLGVTMPIGRRMQLLKWASAKPQRYLIEDDYDSEFRYSGQPIPAMQGLDQQGSVIYTGTFSRSIAPSIRIAYVVLPPTLLEHYQKRFAFYASTVSRFEQNTLHTFIAEGHFTRHLNRVRNIYRQRKEAFITALQSSALGSRIAILGENAGLHFLLQVNNGMTEQQLIYAARRYDCNVYGLSAFYTAPQMASPATLVMGFADLQKERSVEAAALLTQAWQ